ncbi:hypothetical protein C3L33_12047, partial [Rhododendron williamsianum]
MEDRTMMNIFDKKNGGSKGGGGRLLISITVLGSAVIETTLKSYAHEGRLLVLSSDLDEVDENLERVYYDWPMADEQMNALIVPSDYLITSCVPSTLINERYMFQFAFVNQAFTGHFEGLMSNRDALVFVSVVEPGLVKGVVSGKDGAERIYEWL